MNGLPSNHRMHDLQVLRSGGYRTVGLTKLKLTCPLDSFPPGILELGETLEHLDLSGTGLSSLPADIGRRLPNLKIAFFSNCHFASFPRELASCPNLDMVAFRNNDMSHIAEDALPPRLRWLILTDNNLETLPASIGRCDRLQKCMLAGNKLRALPDEMAACRRLALLRLSCNHLESLPPWLFDHPELAFLSFAGNPCATRGGADSLPGGNGDEMARVPWQQIEIQHVLGQGASGVISKGLWQRSDDRADEVAIKLFKGSLTSDGAPADEMAACMAAGRHENLIDVLGKVDGHPDECLSNSGNFKGGLVMELIPPHYQTLGGPPSLDSCTRDTYPADAHLTIAQAVEILLSIARAALHLHARGIAHGDLYGHNILKTEDGHAILGDLGASTVYDRDAYPALEKLEVRAFGQLTEDMVLLVERAQQVPETSKQLAMLRLLHDRCTGSGVQERPDLGEISKALCDVRASLGGHRKLLN